MFLYITLTCCSSGSSNNNVRSVDAQLIDNNSEVQVLTLDEIYEATPNMNEEVYVSMKNNLSKNGYNPEATRFIYDSTANEFSIAPEEFQQPEYLVPSDQKNPYGSGVYELDDSDDEEDWYGGDWEEGFGEEHTYVNTMNKEKIYEIQLPKSDNEYTKVDASKRELVKKGSFFGGLKAGVIKRFSVKISVPKKKKNKKLSVDDIRVLRDKAEGGSVLN